MKKNIKFNKIINEIKKNIIKIILNKYKNIYYKKYIMSISYLYIPKDISYIHIYVNFININNENKIKKNINILQKNSKYISNILKKKINIKYIPKIHFKYDNFIKKVNNLFNKINKN